MRTYLLPFAISMAAIAVVTGVACGDGADTPEAAPSPTATATSTATVTVTATEAAPTATAAPAETAETAIPVVTATAAPEATVTATPSPVAEELPQVLWVLSDHAGPGVVTIRWTTNVPTTGEVRVMTGHAGDAFVFADTSGVPGTEHAVSVPANVGRYTVLVEDAFGQQASATLRYAKDPQGIEWGTGALAPLLKADGSKHLAIQWGFVTGHPGNAHAASARIFTKDANCTTADACQGTPLDPQANAQREHTPGADRYTVYRTIPGRTYDYQVLVVQPLSDDQTAVTFLQLEIRGDQLPKPELVGPGTITS